MKFIKNDKKNLISILNMEMLLSERSMSRNDMVMGAIFNKMNI